jgi:hypothetical protein
MGLVSRAGVMPGSYTTDVVGPLARTVQDLAVVLGVLAGADPLDYSTGESAGKSFADYTQFLREGDLRGTRIGVARKGFCGVTEEIDAAFESAVEVLKQLGAEIVDELVLRKINFGGYSKETKRLLEILDERARLDYFETLHPDSAIDSFERFHYVALTSQYPTLVDLKAMLRGISLKDVADARNAPPELMQALREAQRRFFAEQRKLLLPLLDGKQLDAVVFPTKTKLAASILPDESYPSGSTGMPELASFSGFPELTVPAGYSREGLPIGLSFLGRAFSEPTLLRLAYAFEQATQHRRSPDLSRRAPRSFGQIPTVPANDKFADAFKLEGATGSVEGNNFSAQIETFEPRHGLSQLIDRTVWYEWAAPEQGLARFDTSESYPARHYLAVYSGTALARLEEVACNNYLEREIGSPHSVMFKADKGVTYKIAVGTNSQLAALGKIVLKWNLSPQRFA